MTTIDRAVAEAVMAAQAARQPKPEVLIVHPDKDGPLEALLCLYETRKNAHDAAEEKWETYKSALTSALRAYNSDENVKSYEIPGGRMYPSLAVSWRKGREYLPTELIRQHIPQVWNAFKQTSKGYWDIRLKSKSAR